MTRPLRENARFQDVMFTLQSEKPLSKKSNCNRISTNDGNFVDKNMAKTDMSSDIVSIANTR